LFHGKSPVGVEFQSLLTGIVNLVEDMSIVLRARWGKAGVSPESISDIALRGKEAARLVLDLDVVRGSRSEG
jgi:hypothetical protein